MNRMYVTARFGVLIGNQTIAKLIEGDTSLNDDDRIEERCDGLLHVTNDNLARAYNFLPARTPTIRKASCPDTSHWMSSSADSCPGR